MFFILVVLIQLLYLLNYFNVFRNHKSNSISPINPVFFPVNVLIVAKNEKANLRELIPLLIKQDYPLFNIFIVDDQSMDGTKEWMQKEVIKYPQIRYLQAKGSPGGKKAALAEALPSIQHDFILLTDADCRPQSIHWISSMIKAFKPETSAVLGYSPYFEQKGWLNELIRLETAYTATLYFSFALRGMPYMAVGRNLCYRKQSLIQNFHPGQYPTLLSGDDDLTINNMSGHHALAIQYERDAWMYTIPKTSYTDWINQKKRHVSTANYYKPIHQMLLLFYYGSLISSWVMVVWVGFYHTWVWPLWLLLKGWTFMWIIRPCLHKLGTSWSFWIWLRAELVYVFSLICLLPFSTIKKWNKW